jgi:hypothetical protein
MDKIEGSLSTAKGSNSDSVDNLNENEVCCCE